MHVEVQGPQEFLEGLRMHLQDFLENAGYNKGPKLTSMGTGLVIEFVKDSTIISLQITEESERGTSNLRMESEGDIDDFERIWNQAVLGYTREILERLRSYATDETPFVQLLEVASKF